MVLSKTKLKKRQQKFTKKKKKINQITVFQTMFNPSSEDWNKLPRPQTEDEALQILLKNYTSSTSSTSSNFLPSWKNCNDSTWAGTPSYIPSTTKPISISLLAKRQRPRPRPVPTAATCMSLSPSKNFLAIAYNTASAYNVTLVTSGKKSIHSTARHNVWRLLVVGIYDLRAQNVPVRWLVAGDVDATTGKPCEFEKKCGVKITKLAWSTNGKLIYGGTNLGTLYGWNVVDSQLTVFHDFSEDLVLHEVAATKIKMEESFVKTTAVGRRRR